MSWDKNTHNISEINSIVSTLDKLSEPYKLEIIGKVIGMGLNDTYQFEGTKYYELKRLEFKDEVYLERMHRTNDCDADDTIISHKFKIKDEPKEWHLEVFEDYQEFVNSDETTSPYYGKEIYKRK